MAPRGTSTATSRRTRSSSAARTPRLRCASSRTGDRTFSEHRSQRGVAATNPPAAGAVRNDDNHSDQHVVSPDLGGVQAAYIAGSGRLWKHQYDRRPLPRRQTECVRQVPRWNTAGSHSEYLSAQATSMHLETRIDSLAVASSGAVRSRRGRHCRGAGVFLAIAGRTGVRRRASYRVCTSWCILRGSDVVLETWRDDVAWPG